MFPRKTPVNKTELENARTKALSELENYSSESDEYKKIMRHVKTLSDLIASEKNEKLSPNTLAVILGNVGIASMILWYERDNVLTTRMLPFLSKNKG